MLAFDGHRAGKSLEWPADGAMRLPDHVEPMAAAMAFLEDRFHVVGHSLGAAVAIQRALWHCKHVRSLVVANPRCSPWRPARI